MFAAHEHDRGFDATAGQRLQCLNAIDFRHQHIDEDDIGFTQIREVRGIAPGAGFHLETQLLDLAAQHSAEGGVVIDDEGPPLGLLSDLIVHRDVDVRFGMRR
jgi:hypothetical protein